MKTKQFFLLLIALMSFVAQSIAQCAGFAATAQATQNVSCNGASDGSVQVTATGGTAPYSYIWSSNHCLAAIICDGNGAGTYTATVTDANGCTATASATITEPTQLTTSTSTTKPSCFGTSDGSATVNVTGGTMPYTYLWNTTPMQPTATLTNVFLGTYYVSITDANGCTRTEGVTITQPAPLVVSFTTTENSICSGAPLCVTASGGTAGSTPSGGGVFLCGVGGPYSPTNSSNPTPPSGYSFHWDTGDNVFTTTSCIAVTQARNYIVTVSDANGCSATNFYTVQNNYNPCVFPGDANADGVADNTDLLPIALSNANTGAVRINASTQWQPQTAQDWASNVPNTTTNQKHADCNGDGVILANDTLAILQNYGQVHQRAPQTTTNLNDPPIVCTFPHDTTQALTYPYNLKANVTIGSAAIPAQGIHGIAFTIDYDPTVAGSAYINLANTSWLGAANELYHVQHDDGQGHLDVAISRFDGQQRGGIGIVAECGFVITDNVIGRSPNGFNYPFNVTVSGVKAINAQNVTIPMNGVPTQTVLQNMVLSTNANPLAAKISISPNPTHDILNIRTNGVNIERLVLTNMIGQVLLSQNANAVDMATTRATTTLSLSDLPQGTYFLTIDTPQGRLTQKVVRL
jgi:SprB repeat/Secretion system C-terminal sorting domain